MYGMPEHMVTHNRASTLVLHMFIASYYPGLVYNHHSSILSLISVQGKASTFLYSHVLLNNGSRCMLQCTNRCCSLGEKSRARDTIKDNRRSIFYCWTMLHWLNLNLLEKRERCFRNVWVRWAVQLTFHEFAPLTFSVNNGASFLFTTATHMRYISLLTSGT